MFRLKYLFRKMDLWYFKRNVLYVLVILCCICLVHETSALPQNLKDQRNNNIRNLHKYYSKDSEHFKYNESIINLPKKCGILYIDDKITNGKNASLGQFPFMALLGYNRNILNFNIKNFICGGSIINDEYILTAAHCMDAPLTLVRVGELNLEQEIDCMETYDIDIEVCADPHDDIPIEKKIIHERYNSKSFKNDIALIKVSRKIKYTDFIQPICLPLDFDFENLIETPLRVSGWGKTKTDNMAGSSVLQYAVIDIWRKQECENVLDLEVRPLNESQLCANGRKGQDACTGDSGGPLFAEKAVSFAVRYFQVGIVSFGTTGGCGNEEIPSVYTSVHKYINWIIKNIK